MIAGGEKSKTRWYGYVCHGPHHYVFCYASSLNFEGDNLLTSEDKYPCIFSYGSDSPGYIREHYSYGEYADILLIEFETVVLSLDYLVQFKNSAVGPN
ncbi:hypothetical protein RD792_015883 [Penstemon davidsonii]|uniref:Uncharacterized protein n=1 Tax=Penstemon davidsonii TaxID=160366 RepID=A0ABR0CKI1_9LAMI|nr:hypothetical protein RD792_015883 [Penstemon davidsonii]